VLGGVRSGGVLLGEGLAFTVVDELGFRGLAAGCLLVAFASSGAAVVAFAVVGMSLAGVRVGVLAGWSGFVGRLAIERWGGPGVALGGCFGAATTSLAAVRRTLRLEFAGAGPAL
jgi:hypothetical protein